MAAILRILVGLDGMLPEQFAPAIGRPNPSQGQAGAGSESVTGPFEGSPTEFFPSPAFGE